MIDCQTAQRLFDDLSGNRLDKLVAQQVHQHLADCTDCRVLQQRTARLQRLLALKRYEQPSPLYTANVVANFHRRLAEEESRGPVWNRVLTRLGLDSFITPRYGWAGGCAAFLVVGLCWMGLSNWNETLVQPHVQIDEPSFTSLAVPGFIPVSAGALSSTVPTSDDHATTLSSFGGNLVELVAAGPNTQPSPLSYALDRIAIQPASHETPRADF